MKAFKLIFKLFLLTLSLAILINASSCGGDDGGGDPDPDPQPTAQEKATDDLTAGTWEPAAIIREGIDVTSDFSEFTIAFTSSGYTTQNGGSAWPASGTWTFDGDSSTKIIRDDGVSITINTSTSGSLVMDFSIDEDVFARNKTTSASYSFDLSL